MDRHARQVRLVGTVGQERIGRAEVDVRVGGLAGDVAVRYLAGAGVRRLRVRTAAQAATARAIDPAVLVELAPEGPEDAESAGVAGLQDEVASEIARGALFALQVLRSALEDGR